MDRSLILNRTFILYIPWIIAVFFRDSPSVSYIIAWMGSFFIFYVTLAGRIKPLPADLPVKSQLMRPVFLTQIIFAGYMCCTSIFYFLDVLGYINFSKVSYHLIDQQQLLLSAECQRYYCLAHAAFCSGLFAFMKYPLQHKYTWNAENNAALVFKIALFSVALSLVFRQISGLSQLAHQFGSLGFVSTTLALALSIQSRQHLKTLMCLSIYILNLYTALLSGFKEPVILSVLMLGIFLYPVYRKTVLLTILPLLLMLFLLLPTYNRIYRQEAWFGTNSSAQASKLAIKAILEDHDDKGNWAFFAYRLTEINMFTKYVKSTPESVDFYGTQLLTQSVTSIIPRILWPSKPSTEDMIMERVYKAGVVSEDSVVSAKPAFIADSYLSGGAIAIFICLFSYGAICQLIANSAERLFGGYLLGTAVFFTGLFQVFWRGQSFEFLLNTILWSYVTMYLSSRILVYLNILKPIEDPADQRIL